MRTIKLSIGGALTGLGAALAVGCGYVALAVVIIAIAETPAPMRCTIRTANDRPI